MGPRPQPPPQWLAMADLTTRTSKPMKTCRTTKTTRGGRAAVIRCVRVCHACGQPPRHAPPRRALLLCSVRGPLMAMGVCM